MNNNFLETIEDLNTDISSNIINDNIVGCLESIYNEKLNFLENTDDKNELTQLLAYKEKIYQTIQQHLIKDTSNIYIKNDNIIPWETILLPSNQGEEPVKETNDQTKQTIQFLSRNSYIDKNKNLHLFITLEMIYDYKLNSSLLSGIISYLNYVTQPVTIYIYPNTYADYDIFLFTFLLDVLDFLNTNPKVKEVIGVVTTKMINFGDLFLLINYTKSIISKMTQPYFIFILDYPYINPIYRKIIEDTLNQAIELQILPDSIKENMSKEKIKIMVSMTI